MYYYNEDVQDLINLINEYLNYIMYYYKKIIDIYKNPITFKLHNVLLQIKKFPSRYSKYVILN